MYVITQATPDIQENYKTLSLGPETSLSTLIEEAFKVKNDQTHNKGGQQDKRLMKKSSFGCSDSHLLCWGPQRGEDPTDSQKSPGPKPVCLCLQEDTGRGNVLSTLWWDDQEVPLTSFSFLIISQGDSYTLSGRPKCLPDSRSYLTILMTQQSLRSPQTWQVRKSGISLDTLIYLLCSDLTSQPLSSHDCTVMGDDGQPKGRWFMFLLMCRLGSIITTHSFLYMPECPVPLLGRGWLKIN